MRKIAVQEMVSLDGYFSGPKGEFDWPLADEEFERHANLLLESADTFLLGRVTYEMFASYWPTPCQAAPGCRRLRPGRSSPSPPPRTTPIARSRPR